MQTVNNLREELKILQNRQTELSAQHQAALAELTASRTSVVEGTGSTTEELTSKQAAEMALSGACDELARRVQAKAAELEQEIAQEQRSVQLAKLAKIGCAISDDMNEISRVSAEAMKALNASVIDAVARFEIIARQQDEFSNLYRQIGNVPEHLSAANGQKVEVRQLLNLSLGEILGRVEQETLKEEVKPFGDFFRIALLDSFTRHKLAASGHAAGERAQLNVVTEHDLQQYQHGHKAA